MIIVIRKTVSQQSYLTICGRSLQREKKLQTAKVFAGHEFIKTKKC